ncbi:hypothetical protein HMI54_005165 [Coelomomyces lativittatus]|nr:hypothetical protein HMI56_002989 [Coelomomyces lativittatus]KAJ1516235.1 hypothetical protein HMI55_002726 [Coelomomyces lativittatus]KAJ1517566.1 hypothetical protein HMI54_005165 [Coelomomyces lativittatus]
MSSNGNQNTNFNPLTSSLSHSSTALHTSTFTPNHVTTPSGPAANTSLSVSQTTSSKRHQRTISNLSSKSSSSMADLLPMDETVLSYKLIEALRSGDLTAISKIIHHLKTHFPFAEGKLQFDQTLNEKLGSPLYLSIGMAPSSCIEWLIKQQLVDINETHQQTGETPLHLASKHGRVDILDLLLHQKNINDTILDKQGKLPIDVAKNIEIANKLKSQQNLFVATSTALMHDFSVKPDAIVLLKNLFSNPRVAALVSIHHMDPNTGSTVLHEAAKRNDIDLLTWCLMEQHGDPFVRDRKGKYFYELSKDERIKALFKEAVPKVQPLTKSFSKDIPRLSGLLFKWTNYASGYKARWFVLEDGLLSYYKNQDDVPDSCRGSISMKVASVLTDPSDRHRFDVLGKGSIRYHLRTEHVAEAQRWIQALNQSKKLLDEPTNQETFSHESAPSSEFDPPLSPFTPTHSDPSLDEDLSNVLPHESELPLLLESCKTQLELQTSLLHSLQAQLQSLNLPNSEQSEKFTQHLGTIQVSIHGFKGLFRDLQNMYQDRETYWIRQCDIEKQSKLIYEANLHKLATDYDHIEAEARVLVDTLHRNSKSISKAKGKPKPLLTLDINQASTLHSEAPLNNIVSPSQSYGSSLSDEGEESNEREDDDEEFFDAMAADEESAQKLPLVKLPTSENVPSSASTPVLLITPSLQGYESETYSFSSQLRTGLPVDHALLKNEVGLWSVLKNAIGKDLSRITLPVYFNEPISILQRLCEDIEYSQLLDLAWKQTHSDERILYVAAFAVSSYASTVGRTGKPFNPLLGETFEYVRKDKGFRYISEQVSHHPPISACHCESNHYEFYGEVNMKNKFWGKSLEIHPLGVSHVILKRGHVNEPDEHYSWRKVTTCVHNLIVGTLWIDHYGDMEIVNHQTKDKCIVTFKSTGWRNKDRCAMEGKVYPQNQSTPSWELWGTWDDKLLCRSLKENSSILINTDEEDASKKNYILWKRALAAPLSPSNFNLTTFALTLNQLPPTLPDYLCPTDCRLRPDQRAMENGDYDLAASKKHELEEKQRATRKKNEESGLKHNPCWFTKKLDTDTGEMYWEFSREYWKEREIRKWTNVPDIY